MGESNIAFAATGDSFITRRLPSRSPEAAALAALMANADVRYTNLEVVVRRNEGFPSAQSGGTWATVEPSALDDLRSYGFNLMSWANNHTLDYSYGGLAATERYLDEGAWVHCGAGRDLPAASAPCYLETGGGRVACIAATSSFHESWRAGNPRPGVSGRPGINPMRYHTLHRVSPEQAAQLRTVVESTTVNAIHKLRVKEGFAKPDPEGTLRIGNTLFETAADGQCGEITRPHAEDLQRMLGQIADARAQADSVIVALHCHEMKDGHKDQPPDFLVDYARACIDGGADAVIGHGPHILRAVEIYRQRPIFYSLGNFIFQNETVPYLPADFYEQYGIDLQLPVGAALDVRSKNRSIGLSVNPKVWHSVVARWSMRGGVLQKLEFHPVSLGYKQPREDQGWPCLSDDPAPLQELVELSAAFNTPLQIVDGKAIWP